MRWTLLFVSLTTWVYSAVTYAGMTIECDYGCGDFDDPDVEQVVEIFTDTVHQIFRHCVCLDEALRLRPITPWDKEEEEDDQYLVWDWRKANGFWPARTALEDLTHQPPMISFQISEYSQFLESTLALQNDIHFLYYTAPRLRLKTYQHLLTNLQNIDQTEYGAVDIVDGGRLELYNYGTSTSTSQKITDLIQSVQCHIDQESDLSSSDREYEENKTIVEQAIQNMDALFKEMFIRCLENHQFEGITFHEAIENLIAGDYDRAINLIQQLIHLSDQNGLSDEVSAKLHLLKGTVQSESCLYADAVVSLTEAIQRDPQQQEAHFERAVAYFELGQFDRALEDYLRLDVCDTDKRILRSSIPAFSAGIATGIVAGVGHCVSEFIPETLHSLRGMGIGLWAFSKDPIGASVAFVREATECIEYLRAHSLSQVVQNVVPELQELIQHYEDLNDQEKGQLIGRAIGKYGTDILLCKYSLSAIKAWRNLKHASQMMTLEALASPQTTQKVLQETGKQWAKNEKILQLRRVELQGECIHNVWHRGTFSNTEESVLYHLKKHGNGRSAVQYTREAMDFFEQYKAHGVKTILRDGTQGIKIQVQLPVKDGKSLRKMGGFWTEEGKVVTFWD